MADRPYHDRNRGRSYRRSSDRPDRPVYQEPSAIIIDLHEDLLPKGTRGGEYRRHYPVLVVVGAKKFTVQKVYLKHQLNVAVGDIIDLTQHKDDFITTKRHPASDWSVGLRDLVEEMVAQLLRENEEQYVQFFNNAKLITTKLHQLKLLPGVGEKRVSKILKTRDMKPFESYADIEERVGIDPVAVVTARVLEELEEPQRYHLFTVPVGQ